MEEKEYFLSNENTTIKIEDVDLNYMSSSNQNKNNLLIKLQESNLIKKEITTESNDIFKISNI